MNIKHLRKLGQLTQQQLADKCGINRVTLARIETGIGKPRLDTLQALATALGCTIDVLLKDPAA